MATLRSVLFALSLGLTACAAPGHADVPDDASSSRIVALGDIHGGFDNMVRALRTAGLIDKKRRWSGGDAHLVQLGDLPDRGPDSRKAMDLLRKLEDQSAKAGGRVTVLIGNHEAMMMIGDLRYVHLGEYAAFKTRNSRALRDAYYQQTIAFLKSNAEDPELLPEFNAEYKAQWEKKYPLGYVEHRQAWAPTGDYGRWVLTRPAVAKIGNTLFVHGGISPSYAGMKISDINTRVRTALAQGEQLPEGTIIEDPEGPLWDRGWIRRHQNPENEAELNCVLDSFGVTRMVVGHTPVVPIILPRFGGKVLMADVGLSEHYGGNIALLEIRGDAAFMILENETLQLPQNAAGVEAYFDAAQALVRNPEKITRYREALIQAELEAQAESAQATDATTDSDKPQAAE